MIAQVTHLKPNMYRVMPWKNGGGSTTEIYADPSSQDFDWRISMAKINSNGPFSLFPGIERIIMNLSGPHIKLQHENGNSVLLKALEPYNFSGERETFATMLTKGEATDFNVMTKDNKVKATLSVERGRYPVLDNAHEIADIIFIYVLSGAITTNIWSSLISADESLVIPTTKIKKLALETTLAETVYFLVNFNYV